MIFWFVWQNSAWRQESVRENLRKSERLWCFHFKPFQSGSYESFILPSESKPNGKRQFSARYSIPLRVLILKYKYICAKVNDLFMVACQFEKKIGSLVVLWLMWPNFATVECWLHHDRSYFHTFRIFEKTTIVKTSISYLSFLFNWNI